MRNIKEKYYLDRSFFSLKLKSKLIMLLDQKDIKDYQSYDIRKHEEKYIVSVVNMLKIYNKNKVDLFLIEFEKIIRNKYLPVFKFNNVIQIYKLWQYKPQSCNSILHLSSKLKNRIVLFDDKIWSVILNKSINYKSNELYAIFRIMYKCLKSINIKYKIDIDLINEFFSTKFEEDELPKKAQNIERYIDRKYNLLFAVINCNKSKWTSEQYLFLYSRRKRYENTNMSMLRNKEKEFKRFYLEIFKQNLNYLLWYSFTDLLILFEVYNIRPELFDNINIPKKEKDNLFFYNKCDMLSNYVNNVTNAITTTGDLGNHLNYTNFKISNIFFNKIRSMSNIEFGWFYNSLKGESLRKQSLPFTLSKKANHLFTNTSVTFFINDTLTKLILRYEYISKGTSPAFAREAANLLTDNKQENDYYINIFINLSQKGLKPMFIKEVFDFIKLKRFYETNNNSYTHKKLTNILSDIKYYNNEKLKRLFYKKYKNLKLSACSNTKRYNYNNEYYILIPLQNSIELFLEGESMHHCVFNYEKKCVHGNTTIYSLRKAVPNNIFKRLLTIEVDTSKDIIIQINGLNNRNPKVEEMKVINIWAHENNFTHLIA